MRGFPVLIFIGIVVINVLVRAIKASQEARRQNSERDAVDSDDWSDWKVEKRPSQVASSSPRPVRPVPPPPPMQPVRRIADPAAARSTAGSTAPASIRSRLEQVLREVQQAAEQPKASAAARPAPPPPEPEPLRRVVDDAVSTPVDAQYAVEVPEDNVAPAVPSFAGADTVAAQSINSAFPEGTGGTPQSAGHRQILLKLRGRRDLRRAILVREVLERPRAFDL